MSASSRESGPSDWEHLVDVGFEIGGEDQLSDLRSKYREEPQGESQQKQLQRHWREFVSKVRIQIGTLLKTDTVSFLLGAGASKECGGVLLGKVPLEIERALLEQGISGATKPRVREWLYCLYHAIAHVVGTTAGVPIARQGIVDRYQAILDHGVVDEFPVNYETLLSVLYRWQSAIPQTGRLRLDGNLRINLPRRNIDECLRRATQTLADRCRLPAQGVAPDGLRAHRRLLRKALTRPLNLKRVHFFTLNYDTLLEQAADAEGVVLIDGFVGTIRRVFRPECYDHDLYFPAETTEGRVHRLDRVAHLYKLHGSITWRREQPHSLRNPYGVVAGAIDRAHETELVIYPTPAKVGETLGMPYAELLRRFACTIVRPQSALFVLGYGFGDEHVNAIIQQALVVPSFRLVVADPSPTSGFVEQLRGQRDRRVWIISGRRFGTFTGFVEHVLPDLADEEVRRMVAATQRALGSDGDREDRGIVDG